MIRRGIFLSGLGGSQFATNAAVESLRALRSPARKSAITLAAVDPANPYGTLLPWPRLAEPDDSAPTLHGMSRTSGASVLLVAGELVAYLRRGNPALKLWLPGEPEREEYARAAARALARLALLRQSARAGLLISEINGKPAREHLFGPFLSEAGFVLTAQGYQMRRLQPSNEEDDPEAEQDSDDPAAADLAE
jgi:ATP-dependent Lhr-like helicase